MELLLNRLVHHRLPLGAGVAVAAAGVALVAAADPAAARAIGASALAGAATGLGAIAVLGRQRPGRNTLAVFVAVGGGMMLAAALWSLLLPALDQSTVAWRLDVLAAVALGWWGLRALDRHQPHLHPAASAAGDRSGDASGLSQARGRALRLMVVAIALHNVPEGFAVGAGFGGGDAFGWVTALSIGIQNVPEGLVVATALWALGASRAVAAVGALATGLVEPLGAAAGTLAIGVASFALPVALALAGGAMLYVVFDELLPDTWRHARDTDYGWPARLLAPASFAAGFVAVAAVLAALG